MSRNLYACLTPIEYFVGGGELIDILTKHCERSGRRSDLRDVMVNANDIPYFYGLADGGIEGAQKIIDLIEKYGSIELKVRY